MQESLATTSSTDAVMKCSIELKPAATAKKAAEKGPEIILGRTEESLTHNIVADRDAEKGSTTRESGKR